MAAIPNTLRATQHRGHGVFSVMTTNNAQIVRAARQNLETGRLFGVDFVPCGGKPSFPADAGTAPELSHSDISDVVETKRKALLELATRHDASCPHCTTVKFHSRTVFGEGDPNAQVMFIGEAPGEEEDRTGRPFVGRAGQKLDDIIRAMGFVREQVYIANVLKSRPPENRTPLQHEVDACGPFLAEQIRIIQPKVLVALGGPAAKLLLQTETGITRLRGLWGWYEDAGLRIPIMPTFHPAYILRNYTRDTREKVWSDMQLVLRLLQTGSINIC